MEAVDKYLVRTEDGLMTLFTPPFVASMHDPGYIKGYPAGIRENGGQYTHGVLWGIVAFAMLGNGDRAGELFAMLNPINHARTRTAAQRYRVEPYVACGDVYSDAAQYRPWRLDLVYRLGGLDVPHGGRIHAGHTLAGRNAAHRPRHSQSLAAIRSDASGMAKPPMKFWSKIPSGVARA